MAQDYSSAFTLFRGINKATMESSTKKDIAELAENTSGKYKNKSGITVALNDFTDDFALFRGENRSNITSDDIKGGLNLAKLFQPKNIFETKDGKDLVKDYKKVFQDDIFGSEIELNGGIKYSKEDEDLIQSAINFAKADIYAIEKPRSRANGGGWDGKLAYDDFSSLKGYDGSWHKDIEAIDLDGDSKTITAEEYASYLLAADGYLKYDEAGIIVKNMDNIDGIITAEEAENVANMNDDQLRQLAKVIYDFAIMKD